MESPAPTEGPTTGVTPSKAAFAFIFVTILLDMLALGIMVPVGPRLVQQLDGSTLAHATKIVGFFGFCWALMQFVFSPLVGMLSDRVGRRPIVLMSNLGLGLDYLLAALAPTLSWLFVARLISGITAASFSTASAYVADVTPPEKRAQRFGMLGAAFGLGFVVGPAVGGVLGKIDLRLPFWVAAALSLLNFAYGLFVLPESLPKEKRAKFEWARANPLGSLRLLRSHPVLLGLSVAFFVSMLGHEALPAVFVLYTGHRFGWDEAQTGLSLAVVGIASTVVQGGLIRPAVKKFGEQKALLLGLGFGVASFLVYGLAPVGLVFYVGIPLGALWGLGGPSMQSLMTRFLGPSVQGQFQGALSSLRGISGMVGPLLYSQVLALVVADEASCQLNGHGLLEGAPWLVSAALLSASAMVCLAVLRSAGPQLQAPAAAPGAATH